MPPVNTYSQNQGYVSNGPCSLKGLGGLLALLGFLAAALGAFLSGAATGASGDDTALQAATDTVDKVGGWLLLIALGLLAGAVGQLILDDAVVCVDKGRRGIGYIASLLEAIGLLAATVITFGAAAEMDTLFVGAGQSNVSNVLYLIGVSFHVASLGQNLRLFACLCGCNEQMDDHQHQQMDCSCCLFGSIVRIVGSIATGILLYALAATYAGDDFDNLSDLWLGCGGTLLVYFLGYTIKYFVLLTDSK